VKKLTGEFDNSLGAELIGEHSLASCLSKKSPEDISGLFQQHRPVADADKFCLPHSELVDCTVQVVGIFPTVRADATVVPLMNQMDVLPLVSRHRRSLRPSPS
jgi:hypothetical protein